MGDSLFSYIERLEVLGFFSGYPLVYALVMILTGRREKQNVFSRYKLFSFLPYAYALAGTLYIGMVLRNAYPDYGMDNLLSGLYQPWIRVWALLSLLFWIPVLASRPVLSLLHSLVFFYFILLDLTRYILGRTDNHVIRNDMKVYFDSVLLLSAALVFVFAIHMIYSRLRRSSN